MNIRIRPQTLRGGVLAIPSKSEAHRALICAALSEEPCVIRLKYSSRDIDATTACLRAMGAQIEQTGEALRVTPGPYGENPLLDCAESGSTLRFLLPVAAAKGGARFTGSGRLPKRPISELVCTMKQRGARFSQELLPFSVSGTLDAGEYIVPGNVSSQYISGLLFALPLLKKDSTIKLTTPLESSAYVKMTIGALEAFGIGVTHTQEGFAVGGAQRYCSPGTVEIGGDWSNAAAFLAMGALGAKVCVSGLDFASAQADRAMISILKRMGAKPHSREEGLVFTLARLSGTQIDLRETPDLLPVLAALAACAEGETHFTNAGRLRFKESDRIAASMKLIRALGGEAEERMDGLVVYGKKLTGGTVESCNDHRIVMAATVAAVGCESEVVIKGAEAIQKSYPSFFEDFKQIGGEADVV